MTEPQVSVLLRSLCQTQMARDHETLAQQATRDGWSPTVYLRTLCEREVASRARRRTERLLHESRLPDNKTLANLDQARLPPKVRRQLPALLEGGFPDHAENLLAFGLPGRGKTHLLCALARELILRRGCRVLFIPAVRLVQQLLIA